MEKEIREQLHLLAKEILEKETWNEAEIRTQALEIYKQVTILEFLKEQKTSPTPVSSPDPVPAQTADIQPPKLDELSTAAEEQDVEAPIAPQSKNESEVDDRPQEQDVTPPVQSMNELELFAMEFQAMPEFERKTPESEPKPEVKSEKPQTAAQQNIPLQKQFENHKSRSLNDALHRGLNIGLNDRLAFISHLFDGQAEDYTRVLSQINTLDSFEEARDFIVNQVKPDYNNWETKEVIVQRFMTIVEKNFN